MVVIAIVQKMTEFLLVRRKKNESALCWHFPGGKKDLTDKSEGYTAERETLEETGILCKAREKIGERVHPNTKVKLAYWLCDYVRGKAELREPEEIDAVRWASGEEIIGRIGPDLYLPIRNYLRNYNNGKNSKLDKEKK